MLLSAKSSDALTELAGRYRALPDQSVAGLAYSARRHRSTFAHRLAVTAGDMTELHERLGGARSGRVAQGTSTKVAFLFSGQGAQYPGMGRRLYDSEPVFRASLDETDAVVRSVLGRSLLDAIADDEVHETEVTQPALFALELALATLWRSWGVEPAAVLGHSVGELVAATVAGVMTPAEGARLAALRGRLMQQRCAPGAMAVVMASQELVAPLLAEYDLSLAAINGPASIVTSGASGAVAALCGALKTQGISSKALPVSRAFHSALVDPMLDGFAEVAGTIDFRAPRLPLISNVTGGWSEAPLDAAYWQAHARRPVNFAGGLRTLVDGGFLTLLEVGPAPVLLALARDGMPDEAVLVPSLRRGRDDVQTILDAAGTLFVHGVDVDVETRGTAVDLPTYPFQRRSYWLANGLTAPTSEPVVEEAAPEDVATVIARLLGSDALERDVPLRDLGVDSLLAVEIRKALARHGLSVSLVDVIEAPSIDALSGPVRAAIEPHSVQVDEDQRYAPFGLTPLQQAYLVGRQPGIELGGVSTYFCGEADLESVDLDRLASSFNRLIARHDMLRAVFSADGTQRVLATVPEYRPAHVEAPNLDDLREEVRGQTFAIDTWPLFDIRTARVDDTTTRLYVGFDALIVDGRSTSALLQEWAELYQHPEQEREPLDLRYRDYLQAVAREDDSAARDYWLDRLETLPPAPELPLAVSPSAIGTPALRPPPGAPGRRRLRGLRGPRPAPRADPLGRAVHGVRADARRLERLQPLHAEPARLQPQPDPPAGQGRDRQLQLDFAAGGRQRPDEAVRGSRRGAAAAAVARPRAPRVQRRRRRPRAQPGARRGRPGCDAGRLRQHRRHGQQGHEQPPQRARRAGDAGDELGPHAAGLDRPPGRQRGRRADAQLGRRRCALPGRDARRDVHRLRQAAARAGD